MSHYKEKSMSTKESGNGRAYPWLGMDTEALALDLDRHFHLTLGRDEAADSHYYLYNAAALTLRDRLVERWRPTRQHDFDPPGKRVAYLSMEFLIGRNLCHAAMNMDVTAPLREALYRYGVKLEDVANEERDAGLGNGGLGRLAACFLDSCATLDLPVIGYGLRYEYGMFHQRIKNGYQEESPDHWLEHGNPWEFEAPQDTRRIHFGGHSEYWHDTDGKLKAAWRNTDDVLAVPYDMPVPGYRNNVVNTLRLWKAMATEELHLDAFHEGGYAEAVADKTRAELITMVLYPNDASENGKALRLRQQYFLASASLQDVLARWSSRHGDNFEDFAAYHCFQLNDTHPAVAVAELMRLLMDEHGLGWDAAWRVTTSSVAYTNHTLLPEALECWSVRLFGEWLPRLLDIIYEINARFMDEVSRRWPGDGERQRRMSIVAEGEEPFLRMAHLAIVGSFSVNGVSRLHTELLTGGLLKDFHELWPQRFNSKTNGVTPRRWLAFCNRPLASLISQELGSEWISDFNKIDQLAPLAANAEFRSRWSEARQRNKSRLAELVKARCDVTFDTEMLFDVQVKRIHEYKRQLLNVLHVIHLYQRILDGDTEGMVPRCVLISGKAAPGYVTARLIIKLINNVAAVINADIRVRDWLRVAFLPDFNVTSMEVICAAADLSEQISTAGKEASGTGNMKFMMNGALTIGTLDGANIEIREAVGAENFFLFGLTAEEAEVLRSDYQPQHIIAEDPALSAVIDNLESGCFNRYEPGLFAPLLAAIRCPHDPWLVAADFADYAASQRRVAAAFRDQEHWQRMSILNTAASARFSSDRTITDYAREIWQLSQ